MPKDASGQYVPARVWAEDAANDVPFDPAKWDEQDQGVYDDLNEVRAELLARVQAEIDALRGGIPPEQFDTLREIADELQADNAAWANLVNLVASKAPLANAALTGAPTAPTPDQGDNSTRIATTAFVQALLGGMQQGLITSSAIAAALGYTPADQDHNHDSAYAAASLAQDVAAIGRSVASLDAAAVKSVDDKLPDANGAVALGALAHGPNATDPYDAGGRRIGGLAAPVNAGDAARKADLPDMAPYAMLSGADFTGPLQQGGNDVWHAGNLDLAALGGAKIITSDPLQIPAAGVIVDWAHLQGAEPKYAFMKIKNMATGKIYDFMRMYAGAYYYWALRYDTTNISFKFDGYGGYNTMENLYLHSIDKAVYKLILVGIW